MNIGFAESLKRRTWDCFIFHDVDLLPENDRNLYTCPPLPRHMSVAVDSMAYRYAPNEFTFHATCIALIATLKDDKMHIHAG